MTRILVKYNTHGVLLFAGMLWDEDLAGQLQRIALHPDVATCLDALYAIFTQHPNRADPTSSRNFTVAKEPAAQVQSQGVEGNEVVLAEQEQSGSIAVSMPDSAPQDQAQKVHDVTERTEMRTNPGPPSIDRDMTFDEKRKLSVFIASLDGDQLEQVLEVIMQEPDLSGMSARHVRSFSFICHGFPFCVSQ